jgi:tRNA nucleotidyltransferase (CCA-adding enzyme)
LTDPGAVIAKAVAYSTPSKEEEERLGRIAELVLKRTEAASKAHPEVRGAVLGGSFAKGTWVPGEADLDVFVKFAPEVGEETFERVALEIGDMATKGYPKGKKYAQHPYTEATVEGVKVNVVACYDVLPPHWKSAADRSPFHVELVRKADPGLRAQIRALKKFMKSVGVYGAEIEVQGFSGYAAEVLAMRLGSVASVLRAFAESSFPSPFVLSDPVDGSRDLARAISREKLGRMTLASRGFLRRPSMAYFRGMKGKFRPAVRDSLVAVVFTHRRLSEDTLWGELKRTLAHFAAHAEGRGFEIARSMAASDDSLSSAFLFVPVASALPRFEVRLGPETARVDDTREFLAKNRARAMLSWVGGDGRARILQKREHTEFVPFLKKVVADPLSSVGASAEMAKGIRKTGRVLEGGALRKYASSKKWLEAAMVEIASDTIGTGGA